jgi:flagellar assembly protein FliH
MLTRLLDDGDTGVMPLVWRNDGDKGARPTPGTRPEPDAAGMAAIEQQMRQSYEAGLRDGEAYGRKKLEQQVQEVVGRMAAAMSEVASVRSQVIGRAGADVVRLSMDIARRVLHRELSLDPAALEALVRAALEKLGTQELYRARVHPNQAALVRRCLQEFRPATTIEVVSDVSQPEGGMIFESAQGALDASVETQLLEIERGLADRLGARQ